MNIRQSPKLHISILTCLSFVFALFVLFSHQHVQAAPSSPAPTNVGIANSEAPTVLNGNCPTFSLFTALGCLPFKYDAFTTTAFRWLVGISGSLALASMLYATIMRALAGDNHETIKKANEQFTAGATGLLFIILSVTMLSLMAGQILMVPGF